MKQHKTFSTIMWITIFSLAAGMTALGQWSHDPNVNTPISAAADDQGSPTIVDDGAGGAIITWSDARGVSSDIFAQRVNAAGVVQWTANGVAISTAANDQTYPTILGDGAGGAIITWTDARSGSKNDVYAQKIDQIGYLGKNEPLLTAVRDVAGDQGVKY